MEDAESEDGEGCREDVRAKGAEGCSKMLSTRLGTTAALWSSLQLWLSAQSLHLTGPINIPSQTREGP